jgi:hypothetical protein
VGAYLGLTTAVLGFLAVVLGLLNQWRITRASATTAATAGKVQEISVKVDGTMTSLLTRVDQLVGSMHDQGATVPTALPPPPPAPPTPT